MREREIKFHVPQGFSLNEVELGRKLRMVPEGHARFETVYVDTPDLRLAGWGLSLRHRSGEGWTLKLPPSGSGALVEREEIEFAGASAAGGPPAEARRLAAAFVRTARTRPVVRLRTVRHTHRLEGVDGRAVGVATLDEVRVLGSPPWTFREVEVELAPDVPASLADRVGKRLRIAGASPERTSKYLRSLGSRAPAGPEVVAVAVGRASTPSELVRAAIGRSTVRLMLHDPVVRLGTDAEAVHQARVAARRLRSDLRTFGPHLDSVWAAELGGELRWLGRQLGGLRDADVMLERLRGRILGLPEQDAVASADLLRALETRRGRARRRLATALDEPRYVAVVERLVAASQHPRMGTGAAARGRVLAETLVVPPAGRLRESVGQLGEEPSDEALHRVRIAAKGLRYAAEAVGPAAGQSVARVARAASAAQDVLGEHQDAVVAGGWLRARAARAGRPAAWAKLERMEIEAAAAARARWPAAWDRVERAMNAAGM